LRNLRLLIEYEGTGYHGWQRQDPLPTIQKEIEAVLQQVLNHSVVLHGSGRTDAGVHAAGQVASFNTPRSLSEEKLCLALNSLLPDDVAVLEVTDAPIDFHSRYSAKRKTYQYTLLNSTVPSALKSNFCYLFPMPRDVDAMIDGGKHFVGTHDFSSFKGRKGMSRSNIRTIKSLDIAQNGKYITFCIEANGFLYQMVRIIVGTLLYVGLGKFQSEEVREILEARDRRRAGPTVPGKGLCLLHVRY